MGDAVEDISNEPATPPKPEALLVDDFEAQELVLGASRARLAPPTNEEREPMKDSLSLRAAIVAKWSEPQHHEAAQVIQRWTRGKQGRSVASKLRKAAQDVKTQNKIALAQKRNAQKKKRASVAPLDESQSAQGAGSAEACLLTFRILKMATLGFKGFALPAAADPCDPAVSGEACKSTGQWRYELTLEQVVLSDVGNVLIGWASPISKDADAWQAGFANGETPMFTSPTRWWGPVFSRAQLAADAPDEATVVISVAVDLDAPTPVCWYNLYVDKNIDVEQGMKLESIYSTRDNPTGWNAIDMSDLRQPIDDATNRDGGGAPSPLVYPAFSLSSSVAVSVNFGQQPFDSPPPDACRFGGGNLVEHGVASPVHARKLLLLGGFVLSVDYRERMVGVIEMVAQKGMWDLMRLMLTDKWDQLLPSMNDDDVASLDAESTALLNERGASIEPHRILCMTNGQSKTLIHIAIENKRFTFVDKLFDWLPPNADKELEKLSAASGSTMDKEAVMAAEVKLLGTQDQDGCNPLLLAIQNGQDKMASRILDKAIAIDRLNRELAEEGSAPPHDSVTSRVATQKNESLQSALWAAIETKSDLALRLVDIKDVNNNERNEFGTTPLMRAIEIDNAPMIDELLDAGDHAGDSNMVDIKMENEFGFSAVTLASYLPDREAALEKLLDKAERRGELEAIFAAQCKTEAQRTALMYAIDSENTASAKKLLEYLKVIYERNPQMAMELASIKGGSGATALIIAIDEKNAEVVDALVDLLSKDSLKQKYRDKVRERGGAASQIVADVLLLAVCPSRYTHRRLHIGMLDALVILCRSRSSWPSRMQISHPRMPMARP